jgi:putative membrane protein
MLAKPTIRNWTLAFLVSGVCWPGALAQGAQRQDSGNDTPASTGSETTTTGRHSTSDHEFIRKAAEGGMAEVELGQLANQKAYSQDVKQFGERMVTDHSQANDQLKQIAQQKGVTLPSTLNSKDAALKSRLEQLSGTEFDRVYMQHMVQDHKKDVNEFQAEANNGRDSDVKNFASQTAPKLQEHLSLAEQIAAKTGSSSTSR